MLITKEIMEGFSETNKILNYEFSVSSKPRFPYGGGYEWQYFPKSKLYLYLQDGDNTEEINTLDSISILRESSNIHSNIHDHFLSPSAAAYYRLSRFPNQIHISDDKESLIRLKDFNDLLG